MNDTQDMETVITAQDNLALDGCAGSASSATSWGAQRLLGASDWVGCESGAEPHHA